MESPVDWWIDNGNQWLALKPVAVKVLNGIASAGNSERAHKSYSLVQTKQRTRLGPEKRTC